jgi:hypothetical protein
MHFGVSTNWQPMHTGKRHGLFRSASNYTALSDANMLYAACCGVGNGGALLPMAPGDRACPERTRDRMDGRYTLSMRHLEEMVMQRRGWQAA